MPPDFFAAVIKMHVGEISKPVRARLGFHIIQLTDREPPRRMTFDESREEVGFTLESEKRQAVLQNLGVKLLGRAEFVRLRP
jgi:foldase protein PrsA